jgi:outer membrane protein assembly factor BamA
VLGALLALALVAAQGTERVVDVRVQGNTLTDEAAIVQMAAVEPGQPFTAGLLDTVANRVKAAGRFDRVEVLKRYASIADLSQILLVIVVDEGPVTLRRGADGRVRAERRRGPPLMFLPILGSEEGYGFTYGALVALPDVAGRGTRLSMPLTWGGERRAGLEWEKRLDSTRLTRLRIGGAVLRRESDALGATDTREQGWIRGEREIVRALRLGAWGGVDSVSFDSDRNLVVRTGVDAAVDTRVDPMLSRNAVYVRGAVERLGVRHGPTAVRTLLDANGYVGGPGSSTVVVRVYRDGATRPVPGYLKVLLGRDGTLRGFRAGIAAADTTAAGTLELRVPVTSPLSLGKLGVRAFIDAAAVYDAGASIHDQKFSRGIGGGVWFTATVIRLAVDVAHGSSGATRVQVTSGLLF